MLSIIDHNFSYRISLSDKYFPIYVSDARRNSGTALRNVLCRTNAQAVSGRLLIAAAHILYQARPC